MNENVVCEGIDVCACVKLILFNYKLAQCL